MTTTTETVRTDRVRAQLELIQRLARRTIAQRYKDTAFGALWSLLNPLALLCIYWVLFGSIFKSRWEGEGADISYGVIMFSGIVMFMLFSDIANTASQLVQGNALLVKRTTVSAKVLPLASSLASLFTFGLNFAALMIMYFILEGMPPWTILALPMLVVPLFIMSSGIGLILAVFGAYVRDISQFVPLATTAMLFLSPIFFSLDQMSSEAALAIRVFSPVGLIVDNSKDLIFFGRIPPLGPLALYSLVAVLVFSFGWWLYGVAAKGFGDVV